MIKEMTADEFERECPAYVSIITKNQTAALNILSKKYSRIEREEGGALRVYDASCAEEAVETLYGSGVTVTEVKTAKINLEEYYLNITHGKEETGYGI